MILPSRITLSCTFQRLPFASRHETNPAYGTSLRVWSIKKLPIYDNGYLLSKCKSQTPAIIATPVEYAAYAGEPAKR